MSEKSIIAIAISITISVIFIYRLILKIQKFSADIDLQNKKVSLNTINDSIKNDEKIKTNKETFISSKVIDTNIPLNNYLNITLKDEISSLSCYKAYTEIILNSTLSIYNFLIAFAERNNIIYFDEKMYIEYIHKKTQKIISIIDENIQNSSDDFVNKLSVKYITGKYYTNILNEFKIMYKQIYDNHMLVDKNMDNYILNSCDKYTDKSFFESIISNRMNDDIILIDGTIKKVQTILIKLFYIRCRYIIKNN